MRTNRVYKVMNRPLTILGAERRLFFVALLIREVRLPLSTRRFALPRWHCAPVAIALSRKPAITSKQSSPSN
jgi:hypothetical protein